jgi:hypothetical protein
MRQADRLLPEDLWRNICDDFVKLGVRTASFEQVNNVLAQCLVFVFFSRFGRFHRA